MAVPTEFFKWWIVDERTGKRRLTRYAMTRADAAERYPDAEPDLRTREVRKLPEPGEMHGNWKPPAKEAPEPAAESAALSSCAFCGGEGWVCADHPAEPWPHEGCDAEGVPCLCNPTGAVQWKEIYAEARPDDEPQH